MGQLKPELISTAIRNQVPLNDLASVYQNAMAFKDFQDKQQVREDEMKDRQLTNQAYAAATDDKGQVNQGILLSEMAKAGIGRNIPTAQKAGMELRAKQAEIADKQAGTDKTTQETLYASLKQMDNSIAGLAAKPDVTDRDVYGEMGRLVNAGAFRVQAAQKGISDDEYARELLSTMPVGNPQALKSWLTQTGMRVMDASKRLELTLPKYDEQDRGGDINEGTIDQMTGVRTPGRSIDKSFTTADRTAMRGQNMKAETDRQANDISREAQQSQVVETPQGYAVVNKGTANARPVAIGDQPVLGKDSQVAKNAQMADRTIQMLPMARELLGQNPTASGAGAAADRMLGFMGHSTRGADKAMALEALSGWLTSNVPRMEGPQSNMDTDLYKTMAGRVGDRSLPVSTRLEAVNVVEKIMQKYGGQRDLPFSGPPGTAPATTVAPRPAVPQRYPGPDRRAPSPAAGQPGQRPSLDSFFRQ